MGNWLHKKINPRQHIIEVTSQSVINPQLLSSYFCNSILHNIFFMHCLGPPPLTPKKWGRVFWQVDLCLDIFVIWWISPLPPSYHYNCHAVASDRRGRRGCATYLWDPSQRLEVTALALDDRAEDMAPDNLRRQTKPVKRHHAKRTWWGRIGFVQRRVVWRTAR